jgi:murein DD-endopeptidase MepM/ murein hydrolase activator NlpD
VLPRLLPALLAVGLVLPPTAAAADRAAPGPTALWTSPLAGAPTVTRPFDPPTTGYGPGHRGVDLAGAPGEVVVAAGAGVVLFAGQIAGRSVVSVVHPDGLRTTYEPVEPSVAAGQPVARGSPIGTLVAGHAGCPAAACLHWGLIRGEVYLDPLLLLRAPTVRLLPWVDPASAA